MHSENRSFIEAARRAQLVECAIATIAELGYAKASMAKIASRARVSTGVISYHFGNKDELIDEVVRQVVGDAAAWITPLVVGAETARQALRTLVTANLGYFRDHRAAAVALVQIIHHHQRSDGRSDAYAEQDRAAHEDVRKVLHWGQRTGEFRDFDVGVMATMVRSAIDAVAIKASDDPDLDVDRYAAEMADLFDFATRTEQT